LDGEGELCLGARSVAIGDVVGEGDIPVEVSERLEDIPGGETVGIGLLGEGASGFIGDGSVGVVLVGGESLNLENV